MWKKKTAGIITQNANRVQSSRYFYYFLYFKKSSARAVHFFFTFFFSTRVPADESRPLEASSSISLVVAAVADIPQLRPPSRLQWLLPPLPQQHLSHGPLRPHTDTGSDDDEPSDRGILRIAPHDDRGDEDSDEKARYPDDASRSLQRIRQGAGSSPPSQSRH